MTTPHTVLGGQAEFVKVTEGKAEAHQPGEHTVTWPSRGDIPSTVLPPAELQDSSPIPYLTTRKELEVHPAGIQGRKESL